MFHFSAKKLFIFSKGIIIHKVDSQTETATGIHNNFCCESKAHHQEFQKSKLASVLYNHSEKPESFHFV